ncbi:MAG: SURF1 family protein [Mitsuaria chitosanitabida]|uniref:SURF1 family protein n=1 Tax=Roseateles chitosanitabidus TaxID=65048 RepID=UPI001B012F4A|nr:SURF1 family protein [Roseateles chitosanitabidus]MBO9688713.1 SURF1 family protein [Roseateles chitosanitabidus]
MAETTTLPAAPPRRGRRGVLLIAAVAGIAATVALGLWQLDRADQKKALQRAIDERALLSPIAGRDLPPADLPPPGALEHRRAALTGQWDGAHTVYLDNRVMEGHPGFYVVTPLKLTGRHDAILVQRGWVPRNAARREDLPPVSTPAGDVRIEGRLAASLSRAFELGREPGSGPIRQNVDLAALQAETGLRLLPLVLLQGDPDRVDGPSAAASSASPAVAGPAGASPPNDTSDGMRRHWPAPTVDVHKHYGYAFQWFALAALILGLYVWFQVLAPHRAGRAVGAHD